jgi:hypothetical protein
MKKVFKKICRMSQKDLKKYTAKCLEETHSNIVKGDGYVYAEGEFPVLLVAHLDTVHKNLPTKIIDIDGKLSSPNGIGGDDRCGIYMILQIVKQINCSVVFCEDEEIGCVGADKFIATELAESLKGKFNYIVEFDRKNANDAVFYDCDNKEFEDFITKDYFKTANGIYSDISEIAPFLGAAAVNLSCGYYNAHTVNEYVVWDEMQKSIGKAMKILNRTTETDVFEYIPAPIDIRNYNFNYGFFDDDEYYYNYGYGDYCYEINYVNEDDVFKTYQTLANSELEAIGLFCMEHPDLTYNDIIDVINLDEDIIKK